MRTNIVIDDDLMTRAMRAAGAKTKRETVEMGLASLIQLKEQADIRQLRGKLSWTGDLEQMRSDR
ncbi:MAG: type II toxin-antitoxin system VapB family antitoxin [Gammaproteobacteria bacterium]|nr:type II toxin-antitoxin system VapB family antitoxin [Gammaproteobacteria bacterium]MDE0269850.1 type II toxin-antitoxin system VapB family antitoxin [Gammaproteobacteria bacterium]